MASAGRAGAARVGRGLKADAILDAVRARLAAEGLSTRPWLLLDRDGPAIAFDDTDTLHPSGQPWTWQAVERAIKAALWDVGYFGLATAWHPDSGVVRIAYAAR